MTQNIINFPTDTINPISARTEANIQLIKRLVHAGYTTFPVLHPEDPQYTRPPLSETGERSRGKTPAISNWSKLPYTAHITPEHYSGRNYGIVIPSWLTALDIDIDGGRPGIESYKKLCKATNTDLISLCTFAQKTGSGGLQLFFRKPPEIKLIHNHSEYPGIDILSLGNFVVGMSSISRTGYAYTFLKDEKTGTLKDNLEEPSFLPDIILQLFAKPAESQYDATRAAAGVEDYSENPQSIQNARDWLKVAPPAIEGRNGDKVIYKTIARLHDLAISPATALDLLLEEYNYRCVPPWDMDELCTKIDNVYQYAKRPLGNATPMAAFEVTAESAENAEKLDPILTELQQDEIDEQSWITRLRVTKDESGTLIPVKNEFRNTCLFLANLPPLKNLIRYNLFANTIVTTRPAPWLEQTNPQQIVNFPKTNGLWWNDSDTIQCKAYLDRYHFLDTPGWENGYRVNQEVLNEALQYVATSNSFHPVRDVLNRAADAWDGKPRIHKWLTKYAGVEENSYTCEAGRLIFMGIVIRIFDPGHKFDYMPILEGPQGIGKSMLCRALALQEEWFTDTVFDLSDPKNIIEATSGKLIVESAELVPYGRKSINEIKRYVTTRVDRARAAYARFVTEFPRQNICIGTTNDDQYLMDMTGNRRFLPIKVGTCNVDKLHRDVYQLYGEAVHMWRNIQVELEKTKEPMHEYPITMNGAEAQEIAFAEQKSRLTQDERTAHLQAWLDGRFTKDYPEDCAISGGKVMVMPLHRVASAVFKVQVLKNNRAMQIELGRLFQLLGWEKVRSRDPHTGVRHTAYKRPGYVENDHSDLEALF